MEPNLILLDTGVLISYFRSSSKKDTWFWNLANQFDLGISVITEYEFRIGFKDQQDTFLRDILQLITVFPFDSLGALKAVQIYQDLKKKNQLIPANDIFIASIAVQHQLPLATLNRSHFSRIENLNLLEK